MKKRRFVCAFLSFALAFSFFATSAIFAEGKNTDNNFGLAESGENVIPVFTSDDMKKFDVPDNEALRFTKDMKLGWNLGNTFDAYDGYTKHQKGISMETSWVGAKTSRKLITAVYDAGFNTIRIPVSWHNHVDENDIIDAEWMERVKEVAGWALDLGMYVIVNVHHDNDTRFFYPDSAHYDRSEKYLSSVWQQMAEAFRDFDDHLILESMNEPRLVGSDYEWWLNQSAAECKDAVDCINRLNQKFVDIVRESGGNNATRYLMVPGYCGSPDGLLTSMFTLPSDSAENRLILEAHAYTPYDYALNTKNPDSSFDLEKDTGKKQSISGFMNKLYDKYIANGIPVVIDEFGALKKNDDDLQGRVNFAAFYVASASVRGITCVWWDNHGFSPSGERFGLINRNKVIWVYPDIVLAMVRNCLLNREE